MVDFNNEKTVSTPAVDIVRILWLQARANLIEVLEYYNKAKFKGSEPDLSIVHARLITLYYEMQAYLERTMPKKADKENIFGYDELTKVILSESINEDELKRAFTYLNKRLDKINLIKIDTKQAYNKFNVEEENKIFGLD